MNVVRVMLLWFWCVGETRAAWSPPVQTPPERIRLYYVDVSDFDVTYEGDKVNRLSVGRVLVKPLTKALNCLRKGGKRHLLKTYHGSYNRRLIHGTDRWSLHSWGAAIDINIGLTQPEFLVDCFELAGFTWGGRWESRPDPIHFEIRR